MGLDGVVPAASPFSQDGRQNSYCSGRRCVPGQDLGFSAGAAERKSV